MKQIGFTLMLMVVALSPLAAVCQGLPESPEPQVAVAQSGSSSSHASMPQGTGAAREAGAAEGKAAPPYAKAAAPDGAWRKIQRLRHGDPIVVHSTLGPALGCRFAGATDDSLYCDAPGAPDGSGYRFDRAAVITVEAERPERNYHPAWIASMIGGGLAVGLIATKDNDAGDAARIGAIGALVTGAIGAPLAFLPSDAGGLTVVYPLHGFRVHGHVRLGMRQRLAQR